MKNRINILPLFVFVLLASSCATVLNSKKANINILTNTSTKLVVDGDTVTYQSNDRHIAVERKNKPLLLTVYNDSVSKTILIKAKTSVAYWLNFYPSIHLWTGFIIDTKTNKKYTYPKTVYIDLSEKDDKYLTYKPLPKLNNDYHNSIKVTPLKVFGLINPNIEVSFERKTSAAFSSEVTAAYLLPNRPNERNNAFKSDMKGFKIGLEEKYYFRNSAPAGPYMAMEINYLNTEYRSISQFDSKMTFSDTINFIRMYSDTFGIKKQTLALNFKLGYQFIVKQFSIDCYLGLGLKRREVKHFNRLNLDDTMEMPRHPNIYYISDVNGNFWALSIPWNVSVGWMF